MTALNVRDFGATGRGLENDTVAFQQAATELNAAGGGTLFIPQGEYQVGLQDLAGACGLGYAWRPQPILQLVGCRSPVVIEGEGEHETVLKAAPGLRFGAFEPCRGLPVDTSQFYSPPGSVFIDRDFAASAYNGMIQLVHNRGPITVRNLTLDGNVANLALGGHYSNPSFQLAAVGILAYNNDEVTIEQVTSHHHGLDGITIGWDYGDLKDGEQEGTVTPHTLRHITCQDNARCALSWAGGIGLSAEHCRFNRSGQARFATSPSTGLDIEPENSICRQGRFDDCEFVDNFSWGMVADIGDVDTAPDRDVSIDVEFNGCTFSGRNVAVSPKRPGITFTECRLHGWCIFGFGSPDPELATKFIGCHFEDLGFADFPGSAVVQMSGNNLLFDRCRFVGNKTRAVWLDNDDTRKLVRDSIALHRWSELEPNNPSVSFQSLVRGTRLEQVTFQEDLPVPASADPNKEPRWYIDLGAVVETQDVFVAGPHVRWSGLGGPIGVV